VTTEAASIVIAPVIPAGNPTLRDIREPAPSPWRGLPWLLLAPVAVLLWLFARRKTRARTPIPAPAVVTEPPDPYRVALARLAAIEGEGWAVRGEVDRHYEASADVLREYLESAEEVPARERTTTELLWALPPRLMEGGLRRLAAQVLGEADLVKFARRRPAAEVAAAHLGETRDLLRRWHEADADQPEDAGAVR
jgi:hypothetical protein